MCARCLRCADEHGQNRQHLPALPSGCASARAARKRRLAKPPAGASSPSLSLALLSFAPRIRFRRCRSKA